MVAWIALLPIATASSAVAQDGRAVYAKVTKKLGSAKAISGTVEWGVPVKMSFDFAFMKPNYCKFVGKLQAHYSDGKNLWLADFYEDPILYGKYPAQPSGHKQGLVPSYTFGLEAFTVPEGRGYKFGPVTSTMFEGKPCSSFRMYVELDPDKDVTLFVDPKTDLPLGWAGNTSTNKSQVSYRKLRLDPPLKAADFAYVPPEGSRDRHDKQPKPTIHDQMLPEGGLAPAIEMEDMNGVKFSLAEEAKNHKSGVLLHLWSFSCVGCRQELKKLEALARKYPDVLVVSLTDDISAADLKQYVKEGGFSFRFATLGLGMNNKSPLWDTYKVQGKMSSYLVAPDGKIAQRIPYLDRGWEKLKFNVMILAMDKKRGGG